MNKIIEFDKSYSFAFLEDSSIKIMHPVSDYYLKLNDLSINLIISLKWVLWGFYFFNSLSEELKKLDDGYKLDMLINKSIESVKGIQTVEKNHIIMIDDHVLENHDGLEYLLKTRYSSKIFDTNTKIHLKLKINLKDYIIISNLLFPTLIKYNQEE